MHNLPCTLGGFAPFFRIANAGANTVRFLIETNTDIPTRSSFNNKTNMFVPDSGPELIAGNKPAPVRLPK
jgi:hypothetical protein